MDDGPALALQAALVAALEVDPDVSAVVAGRVYDEPPQDAVLPYLRIGDMDVRPIRSDGAKAWGLAFAVDVHSQPKAGRVEAARATEAVIALLNGWSDALTVGGFRVAWLDLVTSVVRRQADGRTYEARSVFEALLEPLS